MRSEWTVPIRRACAAILLNPKTYRYTSRRPDQAALEQRIKEICKTRVRFGYRRVHVLFTREGWAINMKKIYRVFRELVMQLRNKSPKRRVKAKLRDDRAEAIGPRDVWAIAARQAIACNRRKGTSCTTIWRRAVRSVC